MSHANLLMTVVINRWEGAMKSNPWRTISLLVSVAFLGLVLGCGGGGTSGGGSGTGSSLVGSWFRNGLAIGSQASGCPGEITHDGITTECEPSTVTFQSNGTFTSSIGEAGTWSLVGSTLTVVSGINTQVFTVRWYNRGDTVAFEVPVGGPYPYTEEAFFTRTVPTAPRAWVDIVDEGPVEDISADGSTAIVNQDGNSEHPYGLWTLNSGVLPSPAGLVSLGGLSGSGSLIAGDDGNLSAAFWTQATGVQLIPEYEYARGVSEDGSAIVVVRELSARLGLFRLGSSTVEVPDTLGLEQFPANRAISYSGNVIVGTLWDGTSGFRWRVGDANALVYTGFLPVSLNADGSAVLGFGVDGKTRVWRSSTGLTEVALPAGLSAMMPMDISGDGSVIFVADDGEGMGEGPAWVITSKRSTSLMRLLIEQGSGTEFSSLDIRLDAWHNSQVSKDGKTFTGFVTLYGGGSPKGFVAHLQ